MIKESFYFEGKTQCLKFNIEITQFMNYNPLLRNKNQNNYNFINNELMLGLSWKWDFYLDK